MIPPLIDAALRSLLLALFVWTALRLLRVRSVPAQKAAWTAVLALALLMPLMLPLAARLPGVRIELPMVAQPAASAPYAFSDSGTAAAGAGEALAPEPALAGGNRYPAPIIDGTDRSAPPPEAAPQPATFWRSFSLFQIAALLYFLIAGVLICRLMYGLVSALRLWRAAEPVSLGAAHFAEGLHLRFCQAVTSPMTLGSGVVLPADYGGWDDEKLRIVLAHERAHIRHGDFYLQSLASLYAAVVWFSPLGWWLKHKLTELGEAISDHTGMQEAASCSSYAQILLEFAAAPRPSPSHQISIGVAMARSSRVSRRIERLLNPNAFRQAFAGGRRTLLAALLIPAVLFAATALVRVEAAATQNSTDAASGAVAGQTTGQASPDTALPVAAPDAAQAPAPAEPTPSAAPVPPAHVEVPAIHVNVPAVHVNVPAKHIVIPAKHIDVAAKHIDVPAQHFDFPGQHIDVPAVHVDVPAQHIDIPAQHIDVPAQHIDVPAIHIDTPSSGFTPALHFNVPQSGAQDGAGGQATYGANGTLLAMLDGFDLGTSRHLKRLHGILQNTDVAPIEATFDRTLSVNGKIDLHVMTGSGNIHLTHGPGNQVVIHGRVRSQSASDADEVKAIAANPPIVQDGSAVNIGARHQQGTNHINIDYDIQAPADAVLDAQSGSGNIADEGVGQNANFMTGSGNITATGIQGGFKTQTGSGNIVIENTGAGDAKAQTGSGNIEVRGIVGAFNAQTGSGNIKVNGKPSSNWKLETGSGNVDITSGNAPMTLDAETGSGKISTAQAAAMQVDSDRHRFRGQLSGGGPTVKIETGNGNIRID